LRYLNWRILMGVPRSALMASRCRRLSVRQNPLRALPYKASSRKARDCLTFGESNADGGLVPGTGLEPASCEAADFKSAMFTNFITPAGVRRNGRDSTIVQRPCQTSPSAARKFAHRAPQPPYQGPRYSVTTTYSRLRFHLSGYKIELFSFTNNMRIALGHAFASEVNPIRRGYL
jgi:hypothetical protein